MTEVKTTPTNPLGTRQMALEMGMNDAEYDKVLEILGREPTLTEVGMFSVMWSEHCGYKYSRPILRLISNYRKMADEGTMENAGVIPLGEGLGVVFKMESHNHPSAVEPVQGAATGVGGILRDIFTMGARPIASLDSLRFGPLSDPRTKYLFRGVVEGIAFYGNCLHGEERFVWRGRSGVHFGTIGEYVESRLEDAEQADTETLSFDSETGSACWQPIRQAFRRPGSSFIRVRTSMGRSLTVTPDHPMLTVSNGEERIKPAATLEPGDQIPLLLHWPANEEGEAPALDLLGLLLSDPGAFSDVFVALPDGWTPSDEVRAALRDLEPSVQKRHHYLKNRALPLSYFYWLEALIGVSRSSLALYRRGKANRSKAVIQPDARFARLIGYFLAEGCVSRNARTEKIILSFAPHEEEYIADVVEGLESLGLRACVEQRAHTTVVYATSWLWGHLLKEAWRCGAVAHDKAVPSFVFEWPDVLRREVLKGLLRGDGSLSTKAHGSHAKVTFATASRTLFEQTLALLHSEGVVPSVYVRPSGDCAIEGRSLHRRELYTLEVQNVEGLTALAHAFGDERSAQLAAAISLYDGAKHSFPRYRRDQGLALVKVKGVDVLEGTGPAYDVEVDGTHVFATTSGILTHNCVGVPTVGGEVSFHPSYSGNPLVNAMAIGLVREDQIARATASGVGNPVLLVGARTGRDGIHGATFASVELTEESEAKRSNVQCGDPFTEKLLIEATLEALATGYVAGIQDFGAAGLTCSTCETSAKAGTGMRIDVLKVPRRETGMNAYEVMLSESQERMLAIVEKGHEEDVAKVFRKWGLNAAHIGEVTGDGMVTVDEGDVTVARVPADWLAERCPTYTLETQEPAYIAEVRDRDLSGVPEQESYNQALLDLLSNPTIASKRWVYRQYDHQVQTNTVLVPGAADATVLRVRGTGKGIAATSDCTPRYCYLDPFTGAQAAVAEAARNLACVGARPAGVTDCLNFGNPQKPEAFWQFEQAVKGMAQLCDKWRIPIVSGNVSFYNETPEGAIMPTPTIGMVGILDDVNRHATLGFQRDGDVVLVLGQPARGHAGELGGSEYLATTRGIEAGHPPAIDADAEAALRETLIEGIAKGHIVSAHDISDGGYAVALAECCMVNGLGVEVVCGTDQRRDVALFAENAGRAVVSCRSEFDANELMKIGQSHGCPVALAGWVKGDHLRIGFDRGIIPIDIPVIDLWNAYENAIPNAMAEDPEGSAELEALPESPQPVN